VRSTSYPYGAIDLAAIGTGVTADPDLVAALTNQQVDVNAIDQSLLAELRESVTVNVGVKFPDGSSTGSQRVAGRRPVDVSTSIVNTRRITLLVIAVVLVVLAIVVLLIGRRRRRARAPVRRFEVHARDGETMR
jgi:hypothetical protein